MSENLKNKKRNNTIAEPLKNISNKVNEEDKYEKEFVEYSKYDLLKKSII